MTNYSNLQINHFYELEKIMGPRLESERGTASLASCLLFVFWFFFVFLRHSFTLSPRLECSGAILAHSNLCLPGSCYSHASDFGVPGITGMCHHTQLIFVFLVEMWFCHVGWAGLELLSSSDSPASASQGAGIPGMSHCAPPSFFSFSPLSHTLQPQRSPGTHCLCNTIFLFHTQVSGTPARGLQIFSYTICAMLWSLLPLPG
uniref:Uncharacterized protein n=1 Tax=Macaca fascicularis TaxID=9541 RepID=A0A7N9CPK4_MACFA